MQTFKMKNCVTGDTIDSYSFTFKNGVNPADIGGAAFGLNLFHHRESNQKIRYNTTAGTGINTMTVTDNIVTMPQVPDENTGALRPGKYQGDFIMTKDGESKTLFRVELVFIKNIEA